MARLLIENGAHIDDPGGMGCDGVTPLIDAATNGHMDLVKLLVESKADVMTTDKQVGVDWYHGFILFTNHFILYKLK